MNFAYATAQFCPYSAMPGFMNHQTDRFTAGGGTIPETDFNVRDYDFYGAGKLFVSGVLCVIVHVQSLLLRVLN